MKEFSGPEIRETRERFGLNRPEFAKLCRVPRTTVEGWEYGKGAPKGNDLIRLREVIDELEGITVLEGIPVSPSTKAKMREEAEEAGIDLDDYVSGILEAIYPSTDRFVRQAAPAVGTASGTTEEPGRYSTTTTMLLPIAAHYSCGSGGFSAPDTTQISIDRLPGDPDDSILVRAMGESMEPTIPDRGLVLAKPVEDGASLRKGDIYLLAAGQDDHVIRRFLRDEEGQRVLRADNEDQEIYPPLDNPEAYRAVAKFIRVVEV